MALSLGSPPVGVTHRHVVVEPGLSSSPPGVREGMDPVFYAAYVRDADGNKLCAFVRK